jgi:hypothetical protein
MEMMANLLATPLEDGGFGFDQNLTGAAAAIATAGTDDADYVTTNVTDATTTDDLSLMLVLMLLLVHLQLLLLLLLMMLLLLTLLLTYCYAHCVLIFSIDMSSSQSLLSLCSSPTSTSPFTSRSSPIATLSAFPF